MSITLHWYWKPLTVYLFGSDLNSKYSFKEFFSALLDMTNEILKHDSLKSTILFHIKYGLYNEFRATANFANSLRLALWLNLIYLSKASEFHLPHCLIDLSFSE
jgi:hypothetical protein